MNFKVHQLSLGLLALAAFVMVGCRETVTTTPSSPTGVSRAGELYQAEAEAGVSLDPAAATEGVETVQQIAARRSWASRNDPFSLLASEAAFEREQAFERVLTESGGYRMYYEEPEINYEEERPVIEPMPVWRLAGIAVTEGAVMALLDTGRTVDTIRPGQMVAGTEWMCVSIDTERAIFRRSGNTLPKEIIVDLGAPLDGGLGGAGGGRPAGGGGRPGGIGAPGAPAGGPAGRGGGGRDEDR